MTPDEKFLKAKIQLILTEPFYGALLLNLRIEKKDIPTMSTDGVYLLWSEKFVDTLTVDEVKTVLVHEVLHCAMFHMTRRGNRNPKAWNVAVDYVVNNIIEESNNQAQKAGKTTPFTLPKGALVMKGIDDKCAEELYQEPQEGQGDGASSMGEVSDSPSPGDESKEKELEAQWKVALCQAVKAAEGSGKVPSSMRKLIDNALNPKLSWQEILRNFMKSLAKDNYSWTRPNPRYLQSGFILPSLHSLRCGKIAIAIDTSGSTEPYVKDFLGEARSILSEVLPEKIIFIECDCSVQKVIELDPLDQFPTDFSWGGGTDFRPAFKELEKHEDIECLVYLTDIDGSFPQNAPGYPVLWVSPCGRSVPFGELIEL